MNTIGPRFVIVDLTALQNAGVLMAANEAFFWPLGLALTWTQDEHGAATGLHVREWRFEDGHHEPIVDSANEVSVLRRAAFRAWLGGRRVI